MPSLRRALKNAGARLKYRHIRHVTFKQLSKAGYDVQTFDYGTWPPEPENIARRGMPERLKSPLPVAEPMIVRLRNAVLFDNGVAQLHDRRFYAKRFEKKAKFPERLKKNINPIDLENSPLIHHHNESALIRRHMRCIDLPGTHFSTRSRIYWNFAHFVCDILPLIYYEDLGAIVPGRDSVIAPPLVLPIQKALFQKVFEGYEIVQVPSHEPLKVEELLLPANLCGYVNKVPNPQAFMSLAKRMRRILAPYAGQDRRKVCVSRRDGSMNNRWRNFANVDAYETRMREFGYDVLEISALEPESQFALWANTTDLVGIHGAGMMNMIMMPSGGNYTEIAGSERQNTLILCAMAAGHRVAMLEDSALDALGRIEIDLSRLEELLHDAP